MQKAQYTLAIKKGLELGAEIYPTQNDKLGFTFPSTAAKSAFWDWFISIEKPCLSKGYYSPLRGDNEVIISFTPYTD